MNLRGNPFERPRMGDHLTFRSEIAKLGEKPLRAVVAWLSLVQMDPGHSGRVDLEDWNARKLSPTRCSLRQRRLQPIGRCC
jgi:hypothetical protein